MLSDETIEELKQKKICYKCVGEGYLSDEIRKNGSRGKCSFCGRSPRGYTLEDVAERVETVFEQHFEYVSDQPDDSLSYAISEGMEWERGGDPITFLIADVAQVPSEAAQDIQQILEDKHDDSDLATTGEEGEFSDETHYKEKNITDDSWQQDWYSLEQSLKTEARFFNALAVKYLDSVFSEIETIATNDKKPVVVEAGPGTRWTTLHRARTFQSEAELVKALEQPHKTLGPPPGKITPSGRMNPQGICVFYGATAPEVAIAEVRPPVGSHIGVAQFEITREIKLLNLTALNYLTVKGSFFDPTFVKRLERTKFLNTLTSKFAQPVMPNDEALEYIPTQVIADYLSSREEGPIDGLIYPSVQFAGNNKKFLNVVLFHGAAQVKEPDLPPKTKTTVHVGLKDGDSGPPEYTIFEEVPESADNTKQRSRSNSPFDPDFFRSGSEMYDGWAPYNSRDDRDPTLEINLGSIEVHYVSGVQYSTYKHTVSRHRITGRDPGF